MRTKSLAVETNFHPIITQLLFHLSPIYTGWGSELVITSGSEQTAVHSKHSLHYATPAQAFDLRTWLTADTPEVSEQGATLKAACKAFCAKHSIPEDWVEVILESDHIHIEYQPKRIG